MKVFEREFFSVTWPTLENISVTRPTFPISPSKNEFTISPSKNGKEHFTISDTEPLTLPTELTEENEKGHVPDYPDPDPSLSDLSPNKKKHDKKKKRRKHRKDDSSDPSSSDNSDSSNDSDYRRKLHKRENDRKTNPIKLCAHLTEKLLTTAYKSKIIRLKMDEDPLQRRIFFLTFV